MRKHSCSIVGKTLKRDGYELIRNKFNSVELGVLIDAYESDLAERALHVKSGKGVVCPALFWLKSPPNLVSVMEEDKAKYIEQLKDIIRVRTKAKTDSISLDIRIFHKGPGAKGTQWHQDGAYVPQSTDLLRFNIWIPLDTVTHENGALIYIPQSHKYGLKEHVRDASYDKNMTLYLKDVNGGRCVNANPGDIIVHHQLTVHSSFPNNTESARRAIVCVASVSRN